MRRDAAGTDDAIGVLPHPAVSPASRRCSRAHREHLRQSEQERETQYWMCRAMHLIRELFLDGSEDMAGGLPPARLQRNRRKCNVRFSECGPDKSADNKPRWKRLRRK